jgi:bifunctional non-homologous end joining protein LigD
MNADMHAFVAEVASHPTFLAALKCDPNCAGRGVRLFTRRGYDWTERYPRISAAVAALRAASAVIDGEAVCCDDAGVADFDKVHSRAYDNQVFLYAFDLLELDGEDWRPRPLEERKTKLQKLLARAPAGIRYSGHLDGDGATIFAHACKLGLCLRLLSAQKSGLFAVGRNASFLPAKNSNGFSAQTISGHSIAGRS